MPFICVAIDFFKKAGSDSMVLLSQAITDIEVEG